MSLLRCRALEPFFSPKHANLIVFYIIQSKRVLAEKKFAFKSEGPHRIIYVTHCAFHILDQGATFLFYKFFSLFSAKFTFLTFTQKGLVVEFE